MDETRLYGLVFLYFQIFLELILNLHQSPNRMVSFLHSENKIVICLGKKNEKYLKEINKELKYFDKIITFDHPRYIMQYKFKFLDEYLKNYVEILTKI